MTKASRRRFSKRKINKVFAVVVEGQTEEKYFKSMNQKERNIGIDIKPDRLTNKYKSLIDQYNYVDSLLNQNYDAIFWVLDFDFIINESQYDNQIIQNFITYRRRMENKGVIVIVNNPCFEYWLLLHFTFSNKLYQNCKCAEIDLNKYLPKYKKASDELYSELKKQLPIAINNSKNLNGFDEEEPKKTMSEMHLFFEYEGITQVIGGGD